MRGRRDRAPSPRHRNPRAPRPRPDHQVGALAGHRGPLGEVEPLAADLGERVGAPLAGRALVLIAARAGLGVLDRSDRPEERLARPRGRGPPPRAPSRQTSRSRGTVGGLEAAPRRRVHVAGPRPRARGRRRVAAPTPSGSSPRPRATPRSATCRRGSQLAPSPESATNRRASRRRPGPYPVVAGGSWISPRQAPVSSPPRDSIIILKRSRSSWTRRSRTPSASPTVSIAPSGS